MQITNFGDLLVDYRKAYANKEVKYPKNMSDMMDVMQQQPIRKKKKVPGKSPEKEKEKDKQGEGAASFAQS